MTESSFRPSPRDWLSAKVGGFDAFISYSRSDQRYALGLARMLQGAGFQISLDLLASRAGRKIPREIIKMLFRSRLLLVVVSEHSRNSDNVKLELQAFAKTGGTVLFISTTDAPLPPEWTSTVSVEQVFEEQQAVASGIPSPHVVAAARVALRSWPASARRRVTALGVLALVGVALGGTWHFQRNEAASRARAASAAARVASARSRATLAVERTRRAEETKKRAEIEREAAEAEEQLQSRRAHAYGEALGKLAHILTLWGDPQSAPTPPVDTPFQLQACRPKDHQHDIHVSGPDTDPIELVLFLADGFTLPVDKPPFLIHYYSERPFENAHVLISLRSGATHDLRVNVKKLEDRACPVRAGEVLAAGSP